MQGGKDILPNPKIKKTKQKDILSLEEICLLFQIKITGNY